MMCIRKENIITAIKSTNILEGDDQVSERIQVLN